MLMGMETLKSFGIERGAVKRWTGLFVDSLIVSLKQSRLTIRIEAMLGSLGTLSPLLLLGYGGYLVLQRELSLGTMLALNALATGFLMPLSSLVSTGLQLQETGSYMERINEVMGAPPEQDLDKVRPASPLGARISLCEVSFRYDSTSPLVVRDFSLDIKPGEFVAIVGPSGAGKSTVAKLLLGLYRPSEGRILYDGIDLRELEASSVRRQLGVVPQTPFVFADSIRNNIALAGSDITLDEIVAAAKLAQIHDEIESFPLGYETALTDGGGSVSAGQRQRIALARALVHRPPVLLLDEAMSALDSVTEERIMTSIRALPSTKIAVAHRISTIVKADRILVMVGGRIVEDGKHDELVARGGEYAKLVSAQLV
jgi:ABC-type bacteriocin/lantibiotic exporter with double-glycine peptidase domain